MKCQRHRSAPHFLVRSIDRFTTVRIVNTRPFAIPFSLTLSLAPQSRARTRESSTPWRNLPQAAPWIHQTCSTQCGAFLGISHPSIPPISHYLSPSTYPSANEAARLPPTRRRRQQVCASRTLQAPYPSHCQLRRPPKQAISIGLQERSDGLMPIPSRPKE